MEQDKENLNQQLNNAKRIALDVDEGMRTMYWRHVKDKIEGWLRGEEQKLKLLNARLIRSAEDVEERNDVVKRIALLNQFMNINKTIIEENLSILELAAPFDFKNLRTSSFVK